ncbi:MAG: hypothetical protein FWD64_09275 [Acidobacteriaceae bacterium]|nr:hypothetical protein [Acidobacteriaceae bacterium]
MSAAQVVPMMWAVVERRGARLSSDGDARQADEMAIYRMYTAALLRRYVQMAMGAGRTPSLLGRELFRGPVTRYRMSRFDDIVIFVRDIEYCLARLGWEQQSVLDRVALQGYTLEEAALLAGVSQRTLVRRYAHALDLLTALFLECGLLEPIETCQEGQISKFM